MWPKMKEANTMIKEYSAGDDQLLYVDTSVGLLAENGEPDDSLFLEDRLHLNDKGYKIWNEMVRPLIVTACKRSR